MSVNILDPEKLYLSVVGAKVEGFSEGTFVSIDRVSATFDFRNSLKGTTLAKKDKHVGYTLKFRLDNTAPANTWLHSIYKVQEQYGAIIPIPIVFKDSNGNSNFFCPAALIQEPSNGRGNKVETMEWEILCPKAVNTIGGSGDAPAVVQIIRTLNGLVSLSGMVGLDLTDLKNQAQKVLSSGSDFVGGLFN